MFFEGKIASILAITFFTICIISISYLSFFVSNSGIKKWIYSYALMYGFFISLFETIKYKNTPNFEISPSRAIGATLGLIAGFYFGYQFCNLIKIIDDTCVVEPMESSDVDDTGLTGTPNIKAFANAVCIGFSEAGRQLGSFLGNVLFPV